MKAWKLLLVLTFGAVAACATTAGRWEGSGGKLDRSALAREVGQSMSADHWLTEGNVGDQAVYVKPGAGGHRTFALFRFMDAPGGGSNFELIGKSGHVANWATFGILGAAMQAKARAEIAAWLDAWQRAHPKS